MTSDKILITGGAGFIGSHLVEKLVTKGHEVIVLDNLSARSKLRAHVQKKIQFIEGDVRDFKLVGQATKGCKMIVHLAAVVGVDEVIKRCVEMTETETIGTHNIVNAALQHNVKKIIYASSSAVYEKIVNGFSREEDNLGLVNTYAIAKRLNEKYLEALAQEENISTNALRFFNVYGDRQDTRMVIPRFFEQALRGQSMEIFGTGQQTRDFTHIDDVVQGIIALLSKQSLNGVFNIARGVETTILELAREIKKITKSNSVLEQQAFPMDRLTFKVNRRVGSTEKLFRYTGVQPSIRLNEGLKRYLQGLSQPSKSTIL